MPGHASHVARSWIMHHSAPWLAIHNLRRSDAIEIALMRQITCIEHFQRPMLSHRPSLARARDAACPPSAARAPTERGVAVSRGMNDGRNGPDTELLPHIYYWHWRGSSRPPSRPASPPESAALSAAPLP